MGLVWVYRCSHSKICLEENVQLFKQVTCKCVLPGAKYEPQQQQHTIPVQLHEVSGVIQRTRSSIEHDKLNVLGHSSEKLGISIQFQLRDDDGTF